jgi:hypothetical protein
MKMKTIERFVGRILFTALLIYAGLPAFAQKKSMPVNAERKDFYHLLAQADLKFTYPPGFKEDTAVNNEDFSYDFDIELPGRDFEAWFAVKSQKENWTSYQHTRNDEKARLENPDSLYLGIGAANATALTGDKDNFTPRNIPPDVLARYNADAGKSYLLTLLDFPETKHYKYALLIAIQKNHTGTLVAVYFTNHKDPEFYKNVDRASHCFRFKPPQPNER